MIFITSDTHGDLNRFKNKALRKLKKNDALIICGDFGFIWDGSKKEKRILKKLGKKRYNVLFVEGTHENYDLLEEYEVSDWCGGKTRQISGRLRQLMRGQVYEIAEKRVFTFGGGQSDDAHAEANKWWTREIPNDDELNEGLDNLAACDYNVDYVVTFEPPTRLKEFLDIGNTDRNHINTYLNELMDKLTYKAWFFGKLHKNKLIPPKYYAVFDTVIEADTTKIKKKKEKREKKDG